MSRLELELCTGLAQYVASVIAVGNDEDATEAEYEIAARLEQKLRACPKGARIVVEPIE